MSWDGWCGSVAVRLRLICAGMASREYATDEARRWSIAGGRTRWPLVMLALYLLLPSNAAHAQQAATDSDAYHRAVEYCRGIASRPMTLSPERDILCFDGFATRDTDISPAENLKEFGIFVVRSRGSQTLPTIALSELLRRRHATVVVYDYCLEGCARYFFFASTQTYVLKGALVAWSAAAADLADCGSAARGYFTIAAPKPGPRWPCPENIDDWQLARYKSESAAERGFYGSRTIQPWPRLVRNSPYITGLLNERYKATGVYPDVMWTLTPTLQKIFGTSIHYEAYPASQAEVDAIANGVRIKYSIPQVIYDP
jgi:hypothetical protein